MFSNDDEAMIGDFAAGSGINLQDSTTLFLGDLSIYCTEKDLRKLFRPFGSIETIRIKRGTNNRSNLSYGFLKFSERSAAENAMKNLSGVMFLGRTMR